MDSKSRSLPMAMSVARKNKKKMAEGGMAKKDGDCTSRPDTGWGAVICKADGGMVEEDEQYDTVAKAIMAKRKKMADGGMVDIHENEQEQPNMYNKLNRKALDNDFDSTMDDVSQPLDSNEDRGTEEDTMSSLLDKVSKIRAKMRKQLR